MLVIHSFAAVSSLTASLQERNRAPEAGSCSGVDGEVGGDQFCSGIVDNGDEDWWREDE